MRRLLSKVRFLPLTIFFATLMLTVKVGNIWKGIDEFLNTPIILMDGEAMAQAPEAGAPAGASPEMAADAVPAMDTAMDPAMDPAFAGGEMGGGEDQASISDRMLSDDPTLLTQSEIDLLQKLAERREALEKRSREVEVQSGLLSAAENRIAQKVEELKVLKATIEGLVKEYDKQQEDKLLSLVKIYENMKPKDAARIFEELEMDTLLDVAKKMSERKLAPIMAKMNPIKAREMTVELYQMRKMPEIMADSNG